MINFGDKSIKAIKIGNNDVKKIMLGSTQVWPVEKNYFEDSGVISDMGYINGSSMSINDRVSITYDLPFDLSDDSLITMEVTAPNFNVGMYKKVAIWLTNAYNVELMTIESRNKTTVSKKIRDCKYYSTQFANDKRKLKMTFNTNKTTTTANSTYLGDNCSYKIRIDK